MVGSGFGWSVDYIGTAINIIVEVGKAFPSAGGAMSKYKNASAFLQTLEVTLDHLAKHAELNVSDSYLKDISDQLEHITLAWNAFESFVGKYDQSFGESSSDATLKKAQKIVQFTLKDLSGEVDKMRVAVAQPLQAINTLLSLQMIHETILIPQRPLTEEQGKLLVDAINLAAVPGDLNDRLEAMHSTQHQATARLHTDLAVQTQTITDLHRVLDANFQTFGIRSIPQTLRIVRTHQAQRVQGRRV